MTLWQGRFGEDGPAEELMAYTVSLPYDRRLGADDVACSKAHVRGLVRAGIVSDADARILSTALDRVGEELATDTMAFRPGDEDIHTAVERRVTELAGSVGARLHTGRSRNDQVATDLRMYTKRELGELAAAVMGLQEVLLTVASEVGDAVPARLHPPAEGSAGAFGPPPSGPRLGPLA